MATAGVGIRYSLTGRLGLNLGLTGGSILDGFMAYNDKHENYFMGRKNNYFIGALVGIDF